MSLITWETNAFAFAESWDEEAKRYVGLRAGEQMPLGDLRGVLVKPEVARQQREVEGAEPPPEVGEEPAEPESESEGDAKPRRFYGSVKLDPVRAGRDAGEIAENVIQFLSGLEDADVEVRQRSRRRSPRASRTTSCGR